MKANCLYSFSFVHHNISHSLPVSACVCVQCRGSKLKCHNCKFVSCHFHSRTKMYNVWPISCVMVKRKVSIKNEGNISILSSTYIQYKNVFLGIYMINLSLHCKCQLHYWASSRASYHLQGKYRLVTYLPTILTSYIWFTLMKIVLALTWSMVLDKFFLALV